MMIIIYNYNYIINTICIFLKKYKVCLGEGNISISLSVLILSFIPGNIVTFLNNFLNIFFQFKNAAGLCVSFSSARKQFDS